VAWMRFLTIGQHGGGTWNGSIQDHEPWGMWQLIKKGPDVGLGGSNNL